MPKGQPIPNTGRRSPAALRSKSGRERPGTPSGLLGASRIIPNRYKDEGDIGKWFRHLVRRRENTFWRSETRTELAED